ncbi:MAG TPA: hypothetical protein DCQ30_13520 [Acidimicrobiaceae bacterium]|nr:hypothetical protein [Acidimicrobiaceae bacterium]
MSTRPARQGRDHKRRRAASIYGTIVTAAVIAAAGDTLSTADLAIAVIVTLIVYWLAEQYAGLVAEHTHAGRLPSMQEVRLSLADSFPTVTASFLPLIGLFLSWAVGAGPLEASEVALTVAVVLLFFEGHAAGRAAGLSGVRLLAVSTTAVVLGVAMVVLKALIQRHHQFF